MYQKEALFWPQVNKHTLKSDIRWVKANLFVAKANKAPYSTTPLLTAYYQMSSHPQDNSGYQSGNFSHLQITSVYCSFVEGQSVSAELRGHHLPPLQATLNVSVLRFKS